MIKRVALLCFCLFIYCVSSVCLAAPLTQTAESQALSAYGKLPLFFVENKGQADTSLQFYSYGGQMYFSPEGIYTHFIQRDSTAHDRFRDRYHERDFISLDTTPIHEKHLVLKKRFLNANTHCEIEGEEELPGKINYFIGNDSTKWHTNLRTFKQIRYKNLYPGVDLVYHGNQGPTEYDLVVNPEAHNSVSSPLTQIQFTIEGADKLELSPEGDLLVHTPMGILKEKSPVSYQMKNGIKQTLSSHFTLTSDNTFAFNIPQYDKTQSLVIDPLIYSTFLGGSDDEKAFGLTVDSIGNAYVVGETRSTDFPTTTGTYDNTYNGLWDCFVIKVNTINIEMIYSSYIGGDDNDQAYSLSIDGFGRVYITGYTESSTYPITIGSYDNSYNGGGDSFITKFNTSGSALIYSTYLGGINSDEAGCIALDSSGNIYVAGRTYSPNFPTTVGTFNRTLNGTEDCFITKLNEGGSDLIYSTYLGGSGNPDGESILGVIVDILNRVYVTGFTNSSDFPTTPNSYDCTYNGGNYDAFISRLNINGTGIEYSMFLGGNNWDCASDIAIDSIGNVYITGGTLSTNFPTSMNSFDTTYNGDDDVFLIKINPDLSEIIYATLIGGSSWEDGYAIAIDNDGDAYITGRTGSLNYPTTNDAIYCENQGYCDVFVSKVNQYGTELLYSTYLGGSNWDQGNSIAIDFNKDIILTGYSKSTEFPMVNYPYDPINSGTMCDSFLTKISLDPTFPNINSLPNLKLFTNESVSSIFDLEDYNEGYKGVNYSILTNFLYLTSLSASTVSQGVYNSATSGWNSYVVSNSYGGCTGNNKVRYSTYRLNKLPWIGIRSGEKVVLNLSDYCYSTTGRIIPPSFGSASALAVSDTSQLSVRWIDSSNIEISALSGFTASAWVDVIASPETSDFGIDMDKERLYVYPNLLNIGKFTTFNDIWNYGIEKTTDKVSYPAISFLTTANDGTGTSQPNVMCFDFTSTTQGIKMTPQFSNMIGYEANSWYVARMKVCSPTNNNDLQSQLYHYSGIIPDNAHIDISANIYFGTPTTWSWIETPLYATTTGTGYPQLMLKAGSKTGKLYLAEVQVIKAVPTLYNSTRSKHTLGYAYSNFSSLSYLAMGWSTTECFDNGTSKPALSVVNPGVLTVNFSNAPADGKSLKFTAWNENTQKIYTPSSTPGSEVGMKADINIASGSFDSYNAMVFLGCYGVATNGSYEFYNIGGQLAAMAEFGQITHGTHYLAAPGRNGYHQMQFVLKNSENGILNIQNVDFLRDTDDPYYGDMSLFP